MKSTIAALTRDKSRLTVQHFAAIREHGFRYYCSAVEGIMLYFDGDWVQYNTVRKFVPTLPEMTYE